MRRLAFLPVSALATLLVAAPASANYTLRWADTHDIGGTYSCGVVEETTATIDGTAYFDEDGDWIKDVIRFTYAASYTDPATGNTVSFTTSQIVISNPDALTYNGQGVFVRAPGSGAVLLDVGRLVIDPNDGSTVFRSAKVLGFDPSMLAEIDAAICSLF